jgi:hypothetical protein
MAKAGAKPKNKPKMTDKAQSERFRETARGLGCDMSEEAFKQAFRKIVPPKQRATKRLATK